MRVPAIFLAATLAFALVGEAGAQPATPPAGYADGRFDALAARYVAMTWQLDPVHATLAGVHTNDDQLGDYSDAGYLRRVAFDQRTRRELLTIDFADLTPERSDDAEILRSHIELDLIALDERKTYRHDPTIYLKLAATSVQSLLERNFASAPDRLRAVLAREKAIPAMLAGALRETDDVDPGIVELSRQALGGTIAYFQGPVAAAATSASDPVLASALTASNDAVVAALGNFGADLETGPFLHPSGSFATGPERFTRMLQISELEPALSTAEFERTAIGALERTRSQFVTTARRIDASRSPQAIAASLEAMHPSEDDLLATADRDVAALTHFTEDHHLLTLPPPGDVRVVETPAYLRSGSIASLSAPGALERTATVAYFNLTLPPPDEPAAARASDLSLFNDYAFPLVSAHEVMPGHYANFEIARRERLSEVRRIFVSRSFTEGWAHYVEQMLVEEGWGGGDPRVRLAELQLELQRECRAIVTLRLHSGTMTLADATRFFEDNAYFSEDAARREALRALHDPMAISYLIGKLEILKLRDDYKNKLGARFSLSDFHDALLAHGNPPVAILRKAMLGSDDDGRLLY